jgi:hypothetical protein
MQQCWVCSTYSNKLFLVAIIYTAAAAAAAAAAESDSLPLRSSARMEAFTAHSLYQIFQ